MDAPEPSRSYMKRDPEDSSDMKGDRVEDEDDWEGSDKKKRRSSKSKKHISNAEEVEERDSSGKRKNSGDRIDSRKKSGGSSRAGSGDEDDYEARRESRLKLMKKSQEERNDKKSSSGYQDRDSESSRKVRDVSGSKGHGPSDESERNLSRKTSIKPSVHESSQSKARSKVESSHESEFEKMQERDSRHSDRKESSRDKGHGTRELERNPRRRWDETDPVRKVEESAYLDKADSRSVKASDSLKHASSREKTLDIRVESGESKSRAVDSNSDKVGRSGNKEERRIDGERSKTRGRSEAREEDNRQISLTREDRSDAVRDDKHRRVREKLGSSAEDVEPSAHRLSSRAHGEKSEKHRQQRDGTHGGGRDETEGWERSVNTDEDGRARLRDRSRREVRRTKRSRSTERSGRHRQESDEFDRGFSESDNERSTSLKGKEREKEGYRDDRSKGRDSSWNDRNRDSEGSKDQWKKRQPSRHDKETKDGDGDFDYDKERELQRRDRERMDNEKLHGRPGYRKDRSRTEGAKTSSSFGTTNENSDMIEIRPKSTDYGRDESGSAFGGRRTEVGLPQDFTSGNSDDEWAYMPEDRARMSDMYGGSGDDSPTLDQNVGVSSGRNSFDMQSGGKGRGQKGALNSNRTVSGMNASNGSQTPFGNSQGSGSFNRAIPQGAKGGRLGRGGRGRLPVRDGQRVMPLPLMGPTPFGHIGLPPGPMQPIGPNMSPAPGPPIGPGVFMPPFASSLVWPGARGVEMNMLAVPPGLSPIPPPGTAGPRFAPNMGAGPNHAMYFNQPGPGRGVVPPPSISGPGFNSMGPVGRGMPHDKAPIGWGPPRINGPPGKAPSRGEQNDYSQNFVDTGMRPQNFIRELELTSVVEDYPKLRELIQKKDEIVAKSASPPMYYKCDLREHVLSPDFFGTKFDVILVDPPWEEYVHRAPGVADHMEYWTFEEIQNLKIEAIADTPSFIFLWVGDGVGLEQGRQCLKKWGFRRCEDICWVKTNKGNATPGLRHDSHTLFQHSKEHCLMGIKGTVRRSTDGHIIHANIDTDIIIAEEPPYGSTIKPEDLYRIIEHFSLGRRRLELFGEDHNIRSGWLTVGKGLSSSNFNNEVYIRNFSDKEGKVWQGGGGRNPPPDAPHLVLTTPEIESLRPKSPPQKNQLQQQQPTPISQTTSNPTNKRPTVNSPQNLSAIPVLGSNQEAPGSNPPTPVPWASSMGGAKGPEIGNASSDDKIFDGYGFNIASCAQASGDHVDFEPHRAVNML